MYFIAPVFLFGNKTAPPFKVKEVYSGNEGEKEEIRKLMKARFNDCNAIYSRSVFEISRRV